MRSPLTHTFLILAMLTACSTSFENKVTNDPRFSSGVEFGTNKSIKPKTFAFGDYFFVAGFSDSNANLAMFYQQKEILSKTSADGYFDSVAAANLNDDGISDFLIYNSFEDGTEVYSLTSKSDTTFAYKMQGSENE